MAGLLASVMLLSACNSTTPPVDTTTDSGTAAETVTAVDTNTDAEKTTEENPSPADELTFSHKGGVYTQTIAVEMTAPEGQTIRYTTDGSVPTKRSKEYKSALPVDKGAMTLRPKK